MKTARQARAVLESLERLHPHATTELHYSNAFELLVATVLSAQTTDVGVNAVTPALFASYPDASALAGADPAALEGAIRTTGFFRQKARSLIGIAAALVERHGGQVPADMDALVQLPGVGRKTANVVLGHALGVPGFPVDRHVLRVANRLDLAATDDPEVAEQQLCALFPSEAWTLASDTLILHGRRVCRPTPHCDRCPVRKACAVGGVGQDGPVARRGATRGGRVAGAAVTGDEATSRARTATRSRRPRSSEP